MAREKKGTKTARILYRPIGIMSGILGGIIAGQLFKQVWKYGTPGPNADAPDALQSEYRMRNIVAAAALQGAIFATVKALVDRAGARAFQRWTGEWPGD